MTINEFKEQINFASDAMTNTDAPNSVKVLVKLLNRTVCLDIVEIGFNDKENKIYIEVEREK